MRRRKKINATSDRSGTVQIFAISVVQQQLIQLFFLLLRHILVSFKDYIDVRSIYVFNHPFFPKKNKTKTKNVPLSYVFVCLLVSLSLYLSPASAFDTVGFETMTGVTPGAFEIASRWTRPIRPIPITPTLIESFVSPSMAVIANDDDLEEEA